MLAITLCDRIRPGMFSFRERKLKENLTRGIYLIIARLFYYPKQLLFHFVTETPFTFFPLIPCLTCCI